MRRLIAFVLVSLLCAGASWAQGPSASTSVAGASRAALIGTYKLVAIERRQADGTVLPPRSEHPTGYLFYDASGLMASLIQQSGRKRYAAAQPTPEEAVATVISYAAYFGTWVVNAGDGTVTHHKQGSFDPNETGTDERRRVELKGNQLVLTSVGGLEVQSTVTWERLPELTTLTPLYHKFIGFKKLVGNDIKDAKGNVIPGPAGGVGSGGMTANPGQSGYIIYSSAGVMAVEMMQPNRPKYTGAQPAGQEARAILASYNAYFGPYVIREADDIVVHQRAGSFNPNTIEDVPRKFTFEGNRLTLMPPSTDPNRQGYLVWEALPNSPGAPTR